MQNLIRSVPWRGSAAPQFPAVVPIAMGPQVSQWSFHQARAFLLVEGPVGAGGANVRVWSGQRGSGKPIAVSRQRKWRGTPKPAEARASRRSEMVSDQYPPPGYRRARDAGSQAHRSAPTSARWVARRWRPDRLSILEARGDEARACCCAPTWSPGAWQQTEEPVDQSRGARWSCRLSWHPSDGRYHPDPPVPYSAARDPASPGRAHRRAGAAGDGDPGPQAAPAAPCARGPRFIAPPTVVCW